MWPIKIPTDVSGSHAAVLKLAEEAVESGLAGNLRVVLARDPRDPARGWRPACGRLDLCRPGDPAAHGVQPVGPVQILEECVDGLELLRRLQVAMAGEPLVVRGESVVDHAMGTAWHAYHHTRDWMNCGTTWPCVVAAPHTEIPSRPYVHQLIEDRGPVGAFKDLDALVRRVTGFRMTSGSGRDTRLNRFQLVIWDYRGRIDTFAVVANRVVIGVTPKNDPSLRLVALVSGKHSEKPIAATAPDLTTVALDEPVLRAKATLTVDETVVADADRDYPREALIAALDGHQAAEDVQSRPDPEPDVARLLQEYADADRRRREAYAHHVAGIRHLPYKERAEAWLAFDAERQLLFPDAEAIVYLISRGKARQEWIDDLISKWRHAADDAKRQYAEPVLIHHIGSSASDEPRTSELVLARPVPLDVSTVHSTILPNFWSGLDHHDQTMDATMLRAAEWTDVGGFEDWWRRLAREMTERTLEGDIDATSPRSAILAFNLARSDLGLESMPRVADHYLSLAEVRHPAWRSDDKGQPEGDFLVAATVAFVHLRVRGAGGSLVGAACEELLRHQQQCGAWCIRTSLPEPCVMTTAYAIHALAIAKPAGWSRSVSSASDWLKTQQRPSGCWKNWDPIHLTVLVLDALTLAEGGTSVTFGARRPLLCQPVQRDPHGYPSITVNPVNFEVFGGEQFERLVFAYHLRVTRWRSLEWYGQVGSDLGRDILGILDSDEQAGQVVCIQCVNREHLSFDKARRDLDKAVAAPTGRPDHFRFVCRSAISAEMRDRIKAHAKSLSIQQCDVWSGNEFEERLRTSAESLLQRFCAGIAFPDAAKDLEAFVGVPGGGHR